MESELDRLKADMGKGKPIKMDVLQEVKPHPPQVRLREEHEEDSDDLNDDGECCYPLPNRIYHQWVTLHLTLYADVGCCPSPDLICQCWVLPFT